MPILVMEQPELGFRFAWDPEARALYSISHINGETKEQIAANIFNPEVAKLATTMWCRGYKSRMREVVRNPNVRHYQMLAEMGQVGSELVGANPTTTPAAVQWDDNLG